MKHKNPLTADLICKIISSTERLLKLIIGLKENPTPEKTGGYLTILDRKTGMTLLVVAIGEIPNDKLIKYFTLSQEKATRLIANHNHYSSWQSRKLSEFKYGGAVAGTGLIFSFSGLDEQCDETISLSLALEYDHLLIDSVTTVSILNVSHNKIFSPLTKAIKDENMYWQCPNCEEINEKTKFTCSRCLHIQP